jgi:hypothetical protein
MLSCATRAGPWVEFPFLLFWDNSMRNRLNTHGSAPSLFGQKPKAVEMYTETKISFPKV